MGSRVTQPRDEPCRWRDDWNPDHDSEQGVQSWLNGMTETMRTLRMGEIEALRQLAAEGLVGAGDTERFEPVARFPDLFELKWKFRRPGKKIVHLRQYHIEPSRLPDMLVAVHRHLKNVDGSAAQQREAQNGEMAYAKLRAVGRERDDWGIDTTYKL